MSKLANMQMCKWNTEMHSKNGSHLHISELIVVRTLPPVQRVGVTFPKRPTFAWQLVNEQIRKLANVQMEYRNAFENESHLHIFAFAHYHIILTAIPTCT